MRKLFGTDGVRGAANTELTPELAFHLGRAGAHVLTRESNHTPKILIGTDTRISADMLEAALTAGMCSVGAEVILAGVLPTPAVAHLVRQYGLDAGVVVSASHNPFADNGIKFFNHRGYKLSDALEDEIECIIAEGCQIPVPQGAGIGFRREAETALDDYLAFLKTTMGSQRLDGLKIVIDCAHGATYQAAPLLLFDLGAEVSVLANEPNGTNINDNCGSTHMDALVDFVRANDIDLAFAFDGDGDRCLAVDEHGTILDGDEIMSICGNNMRTHGNLAQNTIVATVMSNLGLTLMGRDHGITIDQTKVGDRYVLERMLEYGFNFGGEQSGHLIFLDHNTTGDGILTALQLASIVKRTGKPLSALNTYMRKLPQVLVGAKVRNDRKLQFRENDRIRRELAALDAQFAGTGRILVRPSGTEPLIRVMLEGEDINLLTAEANRIARLLEDELQS